MLSEEIHHKQTAVQKYSLLDTKIDNVTLALARNISLTTENINASIFLI